MNHLNHTVVQAAAQVSKDSLSFGAARLVVAVLILAAIFGVIWLATKIGRLLFRRSGS